MSLLSDEMLPYWEADLLAQVLGISTIDFQACVVANQHEAALFNPERAGEMTDEAVEQHRLAVEHITAHKLQEPRAVIARWLATRKQVEQ